jgi:citrate synthase
MVRFMVGWNYICTFQITGNTGGANEAVIRMLISIGRYVAHPCQVYSVNNSDSPENVPAFLDAVKRREKVLSGFGHR